jgi:alpha-L-fucosidase
MGIELLSASCKNVWGTPDKFGYKDFIPMFKAEKFDANQWVDIFKKSGAKYIVPVAEHHDGFAMYKTDLSRWNACTMGPKRDVIGELAEAIRKQGLIFGLSSHRAEHWWYMAEGKKLKSDVSDPEFADFYGPATQSSIRLIPKTESLCPRNS